jgi:four helix bundle protein
MNPENQTRINLENWWGKTSRKVLASIDSRVKEYDLEIRTERFAGLARAFVRIVDKDLANIEDCKQLVRSSGSTAANCIEANEGFSKKDRVFRFKVCRKEARESRLWLTLMYVSSPELIAEKNRLVDEATQLTKIFSAIIRGIGGADREQNG